MYFIIKLRSDNLMLQLQKEQMISYFVLSMHEILMYRYKKY